MFGWGVLFDNTCPAPDNTRWRRNKLPTRFQCVPVCHAASAGLGGESGPESAFASRAPAAATTSTGWGQRGHSMALSPRDSHTVHSLRSTPVAVVAGRETGAVLSISDRCCADHPSAGAAAHDGQPHSSWRSSAEAAGGIALCNPAARIPVSCDWPNVHLHNDEQSCFELQRAGRPVQLHQRSELEDADWLGHGCGGDCQRLLLLYGDHVHRNRCVQPAPHGMPVAAF